jgi:diguanylate cyclase (GGDEF)-like protein
MASHPPSNPRGATAFAEAPDEQARMGKISGVLWSVAAMVTAVALFLPGAQHAPIGWVLGLSAAVLAYGYCSVTGVIPWQRASMMALAIGAMATIPVIGLALYLTGGSLSYVEPLMVCSLPYIALFPPRWAWPLAVELVLVAGTPLLYDAGAIDNAYLPRYLAIVAGYLAATWVMVGLKHRLVDAEARQRVFANRDPLTGIGNRRNFDATLHRELALRAGAGARAGDEESPLALLVFDLDDFKGINDRYGHQVGDAVLCEAAARIAAILRASDTLARIGGDEFAVIAPGARGEGPQRMAEAIRAAVAEGEPESEAPTPSASIGWAVFPEDGRDFETLMQVADRRMLERKRGDHFSLGQSRTAPHPPVT